MNKEEFRRHCEQQIDRCIMLHDSKHLKEHELSLALLNECKTKKKEKENLIKYLEDKIEDCDYQIDIIGDYQKICEERAYRDILERVKKW